MYKQLNRISMKQLCEQLQTEFGDVVICTISPFSPSIHIVPNLDHDFFSQYDILMVTQYCLAHNLGFYFDCDHGRIVVYQSPISELISRHK